MRSLTPCSDPDKHVIVQTAPAVRVALGEEFGMPIGTNRDRAKWSRPCSRWALTRCLTPTSRADLTIMEEATEFIDRVHERRQAAPDHLLLSRLGQILRALLSRHDRATCPPANRRSRCSAPVAKTYYAEKMGIDPKDIVVVSIMPCTAKKFEAERTDNPAAKGLPDIDVSPDHP